MMSENKDGKSGGYPAEVIARCRANRNGICRNTPFGDGLPEADVQERERNVKLSLLEQDKPEPFSFADIFEVPDFTYNARTGEMALKADIFLINPVEFLELSAEIVDTESETVLYRVAASKGQNDRTLILEWKKALFGVKSGARVAAVVYGKWGRRSHPKNDLTIVREANSSYPGLTYNHIWPKKEESMVVLGNPGAVWPTDRVTGDADCIVIALVRRPTDEKDVDYLCGYGYKPYPYPTLAVPGQGEILLPPGVEPIFNDDQHKNRVKCMLYKQSGGACVVADSSRPDYELPEAKVELTQYGNGYRYRFISWDKSYLGPKDWKKEKYDYRLELTLYGKQNGVCKPFYLSIDSRPGYESITDLIRTLEVMYGCVAPDTPVRMADGSVREICRIEVGDVVKSRDNRLMRVDNVWKGPEKERMYEICAGDGCRVSATKTHPIWVKDASGNEGWKQACQCLETDQVLVEKPDSGEAGFVKIMRILEKAPCETVYNLQLVLVEESAAAVDGCMFCGGILTGDNGVQNGESEQFLKEGL